MYKSLSKTDYLKMLNLPDSYRVDGFISFGSSSPDKQLPRLFQALEKAGQKYEHQQFQGYMRDIHEIKIKQKTFWFEVVYGGVMLSEHLHLACLFGSKINLHLGSCGALSPKLASADILIPSFSYGNESSTRFYDRQNATNLHYPDQDLTESIYVKIGSDRAVFAGPIVTCAAMLGETQEDVLAWSSEGYFGVEMETSTIFAVSRHFNVPASSLLYVTDNLIQGQVVGDAAHQSQKEQRAASASYIFDTALFFLLSS